MAESKPDFAKASPRPWTVKNATVLCGGWTVYPKKKTICTVRPYPYTLEADREGFANAALIVHAVNCHEELVDALDEAINYVGAMVAIHGGDEGRATLAKCTAAYARAKAGDSQ